VADDGDDGIPPDNVVPITSGRRGGKAKSGTAKAKAKEKRGRYGMILAELDANPLTVGLVAYDNFARVPMLMRPVPMIGQRIEEGFEPRPLADADLVTMVIHLEDCGLEKLSPGAVRDVLGIKLQRRKYSPPADLIRSLVWDGVERLSTFFMLYAGVRVEGETEAERAAHRTYIETVTRCLFVSAVARVMDPGCKADTVVVLEGAQGTKKSSLLAVLALRDEWFSDSLPHDVSTKDAKQHLPGKLIVELSEFEAVKRSEAEVVKIFLSARFDKYRPSYGQLEITWPRQNIFVGTTNKTADYLRDDTGNRRFWPLRTGTIDIDGARVIVEQLYAEAYAAYQAGEQWWLDDSVEALAKEAQEERREQDPWEQRVRDFVTTRFPNDRGVRWITTGEILTMLEVPIGRRTRAEEMRVGAVLRAFGGVRKKRRTGTSIVWAYRFDVPM
jgi:predicted P-loop ATPase